METIKLDLIPGKKMPSLHASQYDDGREHGIDLFENGVAYKLDGTETLTINERKGDDCICSLDIENTFADSNHIVFASTEQMCAVWGNNICELVIAKGEKTIGTLNFILEVEPSPTEGGIESESEIKNLERQIEAITEEVIGDNYYTKTQTDSLLNAKANANSVYTKAEVNTKLNAKANVNDVYTKAQVESRLSAKANTGDVYTKSQTDNLLNDKANVTDLPDMTQYYDKSEVDDLLDDKADKSDTYTKEQVDDIVYNILPDDTASGSVANFTTSLELPLKSLEVDVNAVQESGTPTPASPLPISGWNEISLVKCGANLWNENWEIGSFDNTGNPITSNDKIRTVDFIPCKPNVPYYAKGNGMVLFFYDKDKTFISSTSKTNSSFTTPLDAYFIKFRMVTGYGITYNNDMGINYPPTATDYIAYNGTTEVIALGGTYYGGHFTQDKAGHRQFEVNIGFKTFIGEASENWYFLPISTGNMFRINVPDRKNGNITSNMENANYYLCNQAIKAPNNSTGRTNGTFCGGAYNFDIVNNNLTDLASWKTYLASNPLQFKYELATPIIIDLPDGEPIITLNGTNNIYADTGDTDVVFKCSVNDYVSAHSGGNLLGMGGVYLGGAKSGGGEEETNDTEDTEKTKEIDEPKEETKTIGDMKKLGGE